MRWIPTALGEVLITLGLLLLLFVAWQLWWTDVTASREQVGAVKTLERDFRPASPSATKQSASGASPTAGLKTPMKVPNGAAFAVMRIPRFGADYARPVLQGTDHDTLTKGIGHYSGTAFPGQVGNFAVAGHRTTYGRPFSTLDLLRRGDFIIVETKAGYIVYAVERHVIVAPDQVEVIAAVPQHPGARPIQSFLTMTACHPKFSASERYVVFAKLVTRVARANGLPASFMALPAGPVG